MPKTKKKVSLDSFQVTSGKVMCSDPCYEEGDVLVPAKNGEWLANVEMSDEGSWGDRVKKVLVHHIDFSPIGTRSCKSYDTVDNERIFVDSGQAGVYDSSTFRNDKLALTADRIGEHKPICEEDAWYSICCDRTLSKKGYGYVPQGFVTTSGYGDGCYDVDVYKKNGVAVALEITFIEDREDEEDC